MVIISTLKKAQEVFKSAGVSEKNQKYVTSYIRSMELDGISPRTIGNNIEVMTFFAVHVRTDFDQLIEDDLYDFNDALKTYVCQRSNKGNHMSETSKNQYKLGVKRFLKYLGEKLGREDLLKLQEKLVINRGVRNRKLPEDILTEEEVAHMIEAASGVKNKAIIAVMYESGGRLGELVSCRVKDIEWNRHGCKLTFPQGKTGARAIQIVYAASYLRKWLEVHPRKDDPNAPLWVTTRREQVGKTWTYRQMAPRSIQGVIYATAEKAGLKKKCHPHLFRHSRATHLASKFTDQQLKQFFGWTPGSTTPAVYCHLSGRDMDDAVLASYGLKDIRTEHCLTVDKCPRCKGIVNAGAQYCDACGEALTIGAQDNDDATVQKMLSILASHPDILMNLASKIEK